MSRPGFRSGPAGRDRGAGWGGGERRVGREGAADGFVSSALFSQAQILHLMKAEFARARRHRLGLGCMLLQVDRLSQLVDLYGTALRATVRDTLGRLAREKTRGSDLLGVVQDDRYLLMLPHSDLEQTRVVAERLHELFQEYEISMDGRVLALTLSIGITAVGAQQTLFFDSLVGQAEAALEWAVENGGDRIVSFAETRLLDPPEPPRPAPG